MNPIESSSNLSFYEKQYGEMTQDIEKSEGAISILNLEIAKLRAKFISIDPALVGEKRTQSDNLITKIAAQVFFRIRSLLYCLFGSFKTDFIDYKEGLKKLDVCQKSLDELKEKVSKLRIQIEQLKEDAKSIVQTEEAPDQTLKLEDTATQPLESDETATQLLKSDETSKPNHAKLGLISSLMLNSSTPYKLPRGYGYMSPILFQTRGIGSDFMQRLHTPQSSKKPQ